MKRLFVLAAGAGLLAACSDPASRPAAPPKPAAAATAQPATASTPPVPDPVADAINAAGFGDTATVVAGADPVLLRAEVLLDRARFSPGVIDGKPGDNLRQAVLAYERAHALPEDGELDPAVWQALTQTDSAPALQRYTLTAEDVAGPFAPDLPKDFTALSKLDRVGYQSAAEGLAEKFHMDEALLKALNPSADFTQAGTSVLVAAPRAADLPGKVAMIEIDKTHESLRAYDDKGQMLAAYPASVGSAERPAPSGEFAVRAVAPDPVYYYDPKRLTFGQDKAKGALKIAAGPNNPVGATWISLTLPTYGIHGSPDPSLIGKRQSHGCVRLTNWDAVELGKAVQKGAVVRFVGGEPARRG